MLLQRSRDIHFMVNMTERSRSNGCLDTERKLCLFGSRAIFEFTW